VNKRGGYWCSDERTDWLVSRQRYWGTPIPIIHCDSCGAVPVPEDQLPVLLPPLENPLKRDPQNNSSMCDWKKAANSLPVDVYIGGAEHAVRHLYYARFIAHFLHDISILPSREPFRRFLPVGLVLGQTYVDPETGRFISTQRVNKKHLSGKDVQYYEVETNTPVQMYWDKMSKSKFNGIDPSEVVDKHGMDTVRLTMLANVGPHRTRKWTEGDVLYGINNWLNKISRLIEQLIEYSTSLQNSNIPWELKCNMDDPLLVHTPNFFKYHQSIIKRVNGYYDDTFKSSTLVGGPGPSSFMYLRALADLLVMLAPVAPIYASELWSGFQLACLPPAHKNLHQILSLHSNKMVTETSSYSSHWPYDLTKYVLLQPFPKFVSFTETSEPISVHEGLLQIEDA
ncbi:putative leucine--tRNA ligase, mitochondrial, partial [Schistosoma japonicum]